MTTNEPSMAQGDHMMRFPWLFLILVTGVLAVFMLAALIAKNGNPWPLVILANAYLCAFMHWHVKKTTQKKIERDDQR